VRRTLLSLDGLMLAFGSWTLGWWFALALGRGWAIALAFALVVGTLLGVALCRWSPSSTQRTERPDTVLIAIVLAVVVLWPVLTGLGRPALAGVAIVCLVARLAVPVAQRVVGWADVRLVGLAVVAVVAGFAASVGWWALVMVVCLVAGAMVVRPTLVDRWSPESADQLTALRRDLGTPLMLAAFGVLLAVWHVGVRWWAADNMYYLNKAAQISDRAFTFEVKDYLFGADAPHMPIGSILSSFEPLLGTVSAITGAPVTAVLFRVVVPAAMLAVPFALRYAARGLGIRRAGLAAALGTAAILLMTSTSTVALFAQVSYGKAISTVVAMPLLVGAAGNLVQRRDAGSALRATLAGVCAVGLSPSLGSAVLLVLAPFTAAALWCLWTDRADERPALRNVLELLVPLALLGLFALVGQALQQGAGDVQTTTGFRVFLRPEHAWGDAVRGGQMEWFLTTLVVAGATAVHALLPTRARVRRAVGLMLLLLFGVVLGPVTYEPLVADLLDLEWFANRLVWALPVAVVVGTALASLDTRRRLGALTVTAVAVTLGLSGPDLADTNLARVRASTVDVRDAPRAWPWETGIPLQLVRGADALADATPDGGRFLATPLVEEVTTALHIDDLPTYARDIYLVPIGRGRDAPEDFALDERLLLMHGMSGPQPDVTDELWADALETLEVAAVCTGPGIDPKLAEVIEERYRPVGGAGACTDVLVRR
jgi:hypothetical protein